jgi:hypothetical protein
MIQPKKQSFRDGRSASPPSSPGATQAPLVTHVTAQALDKRLGTRLGHAEIRMYPQLEEENPYFKLRQITWPLLILEGRPATMHFMILFREKYSILSSVEYARLISHFGKACFPSCDDGTPASKNKLS